MIWLLTENYLDISTSEANTRDDKLSLQVVSPSSMVALTCPAQGVGSLLSKLNKTPDEPTTDGGLEAPQTELTSPAPQRLFSSQHSKSSLHSLFLLNF